MLKKYFIFIALLPLFVFGQSKVDNRFQKDDKIDKYLPGKPIISYKQDAYLDLLNLALARDLHVGYNRVISKKNYIEVGIKKRFSTLKKSHPFSEAIYSPVSTIKNNNNYTTGTDTFSGRNNYGLHIGYHHCFFGNPLHRTITIGMRADYLTYKINYNFYDYRGGPLVDGIVYNQKVQSFLLNPVFTVRSAITRTLQLESSGIIRFGANRYGDSGVVGSVLHNKNKSYFGFLAEIRLVQLF
jgi:hypothetical protein